MTDTTKDKFSAYKLMVILVILLIAICVATVAGFVYFRGTLEKFADDISSTTGEAHSTRSRVQQLQQTQIELEKYSSTIDRAARIVAESKSYEYQDQIIRDINNYAERAGVSITSFTFSNEAGAGAAPSTPAPASPGNAGASGASAPASAPKSTTVTISLGDSVPYANLLNFMHMIEKNLTKMQIANVALTKAADGDSNDVSLQTLNLEVYVK